MNDYTPTTAQVREEWQYAIQDVDMDGNVVISFDEAGEQFDRWLDAHDEQVRAGERERIAVAIRTEHDEIDRGFSEYRAGLRKAARLIGGVSTEQWVGVLESFDTGIARRGWDAR